MLNKMTRDPITFTAVESDQGSNPAINVATPSTGNAATAGNAG